MTIKIDKRVNSEIKAQRIEFIEPKGGIKNLAHRDLKKWSIITKYAKTNFRSSDIGNGAEGLTSAEEVILRPRPVGAIWPWDRRPSVGAFNPDSLVSEITFGESYLSRRFLGMYPLRENRGRGPRLGFNIFGPEVYENLGTSSWNVFSVTGDYCSLTGWLDETIHGTYGADKLSWTEIEAGFSSINERKYDVEFGKENDGAISLAGVGSFEALIDMHILNFGNFRGFSHRQACREGCLVDWECEYLRLRGIEIDFDTTEADELVWVNYINGVDENVFKSSRVFMAREFINLWRFFGGSERAEGGVKDDVRNLFIENVLFGTDKFEDRRHRIATLFVRGLKIGNRSWGITASGLRQIISKFWAGSVLSSPGRSLLQQYVVGVTRYFGSGRLMYNRNGLYINKTLKINNTILLDVAAFLVYDKLRRLISLEVYLTLFNGGLLRLYWEVGRPGRRPCRDKNKGMEVYGRNGANQVEYVGAWAKNRRAFSFFRRKYARCLKLWYGPPNSWSKDELPLMEVQCYSINDLNGATCFSY